MTLSSIVIASNCQFISDCIFYVLVDFELTVLELWIVERLFQKEMQIFDDPAISRRDFGPTIAGSDRNCTDFSINIPFRCPIYTN